jgi:hypothetical protein
MTGILCLVIIILASAFGNWTDERAKEKARERERQEAGEIANAEYLVSVMCGGRP